MPVLKSNAYGHGFLPVAKCCEESVAVDRFCVVSLSEALELRQNKIAKPIIVLSNYGNDHEQLTSAIRKGITLTIFTIEQARSISRAASAAKKIATVHVELDSGTTRDGVLPADFLDCMMRVKKIKNLRVEGVWSHFSSSETDQATTDKQFHIVIEAKKILEKAGIVVPFWHTDCSAATILYKNTHLNSVRVGLSTYGLYPSDHSRSKIKLKPVLSWKTKVIQTKVIPAGTKIGYNGTYTADRTATIAVLPVGYFDGYDRRLGNNADVLINGKRCPVRGRISMNLTVVDITGVPNVKVGTIATLIGTDKKESVSADELAQKCNTINYEIVTRINGTLPRLVR